MFSGGFDAGTEDDCCDMRVLKRGLFWALGMVKSSGSTVQANGPAWYLQAIR